MQGSVDAMGCNLFMKPFITNAWLAPHPTLPPTPRFSKLTMIPWACHAGQCGCNGLQSVHEAIHHQCMISTPPYPPPPQGFPSLPWFPGHVMQGSVDAMGCNLFMKPFITNAWLAPHPTLPPTPRFSKLTMIPWACHAGQCGCNGLQSVHEAIHHQCMTNTTPHPTLPSLYPTRPSPQGFPNLPWFPAYGHVM